MFLKKSITGVTPLTELWKKWTYIKDTENILKLEKEGFLIIFRVKQEGSCGIKSRWTGVNYSS